MINVWVSKLSTNQPVWNSLAVDRGLGRRRVPTVEDVQHHEVRRVVEQRRARPDEDDEPGERFDVPRARALDLIGIDGVSVSALSWSGSRCCTSTNPMPVFGGRAASNWVNASSPPAEAPMPTIGNNAPLPGSSRLSAIVRRRLRLSGSSRTLLLRAASASRASRHGSTHSRSIAFAS